MTGPLPNDSAGKAGLPRVSATQEFERVYKHPMRKSNAGLFLSPAPAGAKREDGGEVWLRAGCVLIVAYRRERKLEIRRKLRYLSPNLLISDQIPRVPTRISGFGRPLRMRKNKRA